MSVKNKKLTMKNGRENRRSENHADPLLSEQRDYVDDSDAEELDKGFSAKEKLKPQGQIFQTNLITIMSNFAQEESVASGNRNHWNARFDGLTDIMLRIKKAFKKYL